MNEKSPCAAPAIEPDDFTPTSRQALAWVLWHHQGASSQVGQAMRSALGIDATERMPDWMVEDAKQWAALATPAGVDAVPVATELCNKGCEGVLLPHAHTERGQIMIAKVPLASSPKDREDVLRKALNAMLTHMGMDEDEWNKPTFDQARAALAFTAHPSVHSTSDCVAHGLPTPLPDLAATPCEKDIRADRASTEAAPLNGIAANWYHGEGAYARCYYCGRYSLDPRTRSDRRPACECGEKHGWSGSFKKPGPDAKWSGKAPVIQDDREAERLPAGNEVRPQDQPESGGASSRPSTEGAEQEARKPGVSAILYEHEDGHHAVAASAEQAAFAAGDPRWHRVGPVDLGAIQNDAYAEGRKDEQDELASVLPGIWYMDPPDGGAPTILEQLQRQAKDARRYVWLRRDGRPCDKVQFVDVSNGCGAFGAVTEDELDAAIDAAAGFTTKE